jgi:hypothetical protein
MPLALEHSTSEQIRIATSALELRISEQIQVSNAALLAHLRSLIYQAVPTNQQQSIPHDATIAT